MLFISLLIIIDFENNNYNTLKTNFYIVYLTYFSLKLK
jgi:hypothetical protein